MRENLLKDVITKKALIIITDHRGEVIWRQSESPASALFRDYFQGKFQKAEELSIYANQAGLAIAVLSSRLPIKNCYAYQMSQCGLEAFQKQGVHTEYQELIPLVKSSKDPEVVCPIEKFLWEHSEEKERWEFLESRFAPGKGIYTCSIEAHSNKA